MNSKKRSIRNEKYNVGRTYEDKGDFITAKEYFKEAAKLTSELASENYGNKSISAKYLEQLDDIIYRIKNLPNENSFKRKVNKNNNESNNLVNNNISRNQNNETKTENNDNLNDENNQELQLDDLVGLKNVKKTLKELEYYYKQTGGGDSDMTLHMAFLGRPGTGKTLVAKLMARNLFNAGVLPENKLVAISARELVGEHIGSTAPKVKKIVESALGGVLFIDEAYSLADKDSGRDFGKEAIATLLPFMEDKELKLSVILAGYEEETKNMINVNPGLQDRIQRFLIFNDYDDNEMLELSKIFLSGYNNFGEDISYVFTNDAKQEFLRALNILKNDVNYANARSAKKLIGNAKLKCAERTRGNINSRIIIKEDITEALKVHN